MREFGFAILLLAFTGFISAGQHDIYSGYTVHRIEIQERADAELIHSLETELDLDVWQHGYPSLRDAIVMVSPALKTEFLNTLDSNGLNHHLHIADVAKSLNESDAEIARYETRRGGRLMPFESYPRFEVVDAYLDRIAQEYPDIVTLVNAGPSYEGRPVKYLKISTTNFEDTSKPIYFLDAMIHAREWVTTPVALYTIHRLVEDLREGDRDLLEQNDWIVLPIVNPDGYEFTHTGERLFRRTRSVNTVLDTTCLGVDGNRNFDVAFNTVGVSANPCSNTYPGEEAFSEPETRYVRDIMHEHLNRIQLYLNIHSFGNWILYGYGDNTLPPNALNLHHVGAVMGAEIDTHKLPEASFYVVGNSAFLLYGTSGSAQDYGQAIGIPFSYTLELPGYWFQFQVPPQYIEQINEETWHGIAASARLANFYYKLRLSGQS